MRVAVFDDIHTEFGPWAPPVLDARAILLCGDIAVDPNGYRRTVLDVCAANPNADVVAILGNHEFYGHVVDTIVDEYAEALALPRVHFLHNSSIEIDGWQIHGTTLWTDLGNPLHAMSAEFAMSDYRRIGIYDADGSVRMLKASDTTNMHRDSVAFLTRALHPDGGDTARTIVMTHHAPSWRSTPHHDGFEPAYCAKLDDLIVETQPAAWFHGHCHRMSSYHIGQTLVRNNPRGYVPDAENPTFAADLVIDVPAAR